MRFPITAAATCLAAVVIVTAVFGGVDLVQTNLQWLERIEANKIDDLIAACLVIALGVVLDHVRERRRHIAELQAARLRVLQATMRTVHDIVNNFLNNLLLFRIEAEEVLAAESLEVFDGLIQETTRKLRVLSDLETVTERPMAGGAGIEYGQS